MGGYLHSFISRGGEEGVLLTTSFAVLARCYYSANDDEQRRSALLLAFVAMLSCTLEKCQVPLSSALKRNSSMGLFYGLFLVPAVLLEISLHHQQEFNHDKNVVHSVCRDEIKVSFWLILYMLCSWRFRSESAVAKGDIMSLIFFCVTGFAVHVAFKLTVPVAMQAVVSLISIKIASLYLPRCFTIGELLFIVNIMMPFLANFDSMSSIFHVSLVANQVLYFISLFLLSLALPLLSGGMTPWFFYSSGILLLTCLLYVLFLYLPGGFLIWTMNFVLENSPSRQLLLALWAIEILGCGMYVTYFRSTSQKSSTSERKLFHVLILLTFIPGILCDMPMLFLCSVGAICILLLLEATRSLRMPPLGDVLNDRFTVFLDPQDKGCLILTPIYLLLGQSLPIWAICLQYPSFLSMEKTLVPIAAYSGILSVGIGDTAASAIGSRFGTHRWPGTCKTVEGTLSAAIFQWIPILCASNYFSSPEILAAMIASTAISLIEALTSQIDNIILPVYMYFLLNVPMQ